MRKHAARIMEEHKTFSWLFVRGEAPATAERACSRAARLEGAGEATREAPLRATCRRDRCALAWTSKWSNKCLLRPVRCSKARARPDDYSPHAATLQSICVHARASPVHARASPSRLIRVDLTLICEMLRLLFEIIHASVGYTRHRPVYTLLMSGYPPTDPFGLSVQVYM